LHKTHTDEALESVETSQVAPVSTDTDPQTPRKKRRRRRSRRRGKGGAANAVVPQEGAPQPAENGETNAVVPLAPQPRAEAQVQARLERANPQPSPKPKPTQGRKRRQENGARKGANGRRQDIGSWRAEPPGERTRRRPGQAQAHSPALWAAWNAARFSGKGSSDPEA
jgi:hypothetical protein